MSERPWFYWSAFAVSYSRIQLLLKQQLCIIQQGSTMVREKIAIWTTALEETL
jgi:hypothetical protein